MTDKEILEIIEGKDKDYMLGFIKGIINVNEELKKELNELQTLYNNMFKCHCNRVQVEKLLSQQKEFIRWLKDYIGTIKQQKETLAELVIAEVNTLMTLELILVRYKEIIGGKHDRIRIR